MTDRQSVRQTFSFTDRQRQTETETVPRSRVGKCLRFNEITGKEKRKTYKEKTEEEKCEYA